MPYIPSDMKKEVESRGPECPGELNYRITKLLIDYYSLAYNYQAINDVLGALEGAKLEFYRRVVVPYEDQKIKDNGDVYDNT